jgi:hypothetical protein
MLVDLNSGSGFVYGALSAVSNAGISINTLIDAALEAEHRSKPPRDYLGGSRIGEPCARRLAHEVMLTPVDDGKGGRLLRIFDAGHEFEELTFVGCRRLGSNSALGAVTAGSSASASPADACAVTSTASSSPAPTLASRGPRCSSTRR